MRTRHLFCERGYSLYEVIVAVAILILSGAAAGSLFRSTFVTQRDMDRLAQVEVMRRTIREEISCRNSLMIVKEAPLPQLRACKLPTLPIVGRDGVELFSRHVSNEFYRVGDWHVRARCDSANFTVIFEGRLNSKNRTKTEIDRTFGAWRELFNGTSRFCHEYLAPDMASCRNPRYPIMTGFGESGATCCRQLVKDGVGEIVARCDRHEVLTQGGGFCAAPRNVNRTVAKKSITGAWVGNTKPTKTWMSAFPMPHAFILTADAVAANFSPVEQASVPRNGFLAKSLPRENDIGIVSSWETNCRSDDSLEPFPGKSVAICCPRGW